MINIPFIIIICLNVLGLGMTFGRHGRKRTDKHDGWSGLIAFLIHVLLIAWAVWWGF